MPSVSKKQHNLMAAVANNPAFAKKAGIPQRVGADFLKADKGRKFAKGGDMAKKMPPFMGKETKAEEAKEMKVKAKSPAMYRKGEKAEGIHGKSGKEKPTKYATGGGCELKGKTKAFAGGGSSMGAPEPTKYSGPVPTGTGMGSKAPTKYSGPVPTGTSYSPTQSRQQVPTRFGPAKGPVDPMSGMLKGLNPSPEQIKATVMEQARKAKLGAGTPQMTREQMMKIVGAPAPIAVNRAAPGSLGMKKGGAVKTFAKGGGCELKGKTKGRII